MAAIVELAGHAPADRLDGLTQRLVLHDYETPRLGANRAGGKSPQFEDKFHIFIANFAIAIVIAGGDSAFECVKNVLFVKGHISISCEVIAILLKPHTALRRLAVLSSAACLA